MFTALVIGIHLIVCVILILVILLQTGKGADNGAVFGGGSSQTVFGTTGASTFLSRLTIAAAVTFMVTSIVLSYFSGKALTAEYSVMQEQATQSAPGPGEGAPQPMPEAATKQEAPAAPAQQSAPPAEKPAAPAQVPTAPPAQGN